MLWIDPAYETSTCADDSFVKKSTGKGNYDEAENTNEWRGKVASCGASDSYRVNNIYDLAGNVLEWTMEAYATYNRVARGGVYGGSGSGYPASNRHPLQSRRFQPLPTVSVSLYICRAER